MRLPHTATPAPPLQVSLQLPAPHVKFPQASLPEQAAVQSPLVQLMLPHALTPVQVTSQFFVMHEMPRHASALAQSILQEAALPQLIPPHAPALPQVMLHFHAVGQVMLPLPVPVIVQVVVLKSQPPLQIAGQTAASSSRASGGSVPVMQ